MAGLGDMKEGVPRPEETAYDHVGAATLMLQTPAELGSSGDVLGGWVEEVDGPIKVGTLQKGLLEQLGRRMHVKIVGQFAGLRLAQT